MGGELRNTQHKNVLRRMLIGQYVL